MKTRTALIAGLGAGAVIGIGLALKGLVDISVELADELNFDKGLFNDEDDDMEDTVPPDQRAVTSKTCPLCGGGLTRVGDQYHCDYCNRDYDKVTVNLDAKDIRHLDEHMTDRRLVCPACHKALMGLDLSQEKPTLRCRKCEHFEPLVSE